MRLSHHNNTFVFHSQEKRFSPDFFKGLMVAVIFHCMLFVLLRISHPLPKKEPFLPFTQAVAEIYPHTNVTTLPPHFFITFEEANPCLIDHFSQISFSQTPNQKESPLTMDGDFSAIEKIPFVPLQESNL